MRTVADPEFPEVRAPTLRRRMPTYNFPKFSQKLHEIERIWTGGVRIPRALLDPQLEKADLSLNHQGPVQVWTTEPLKHDCLLPLINY